MNDVKLSELLNTLADLSIDGETPEIALLALKLQVALSEVYGDNLL